MVVIVGPKKMPKGGPYHKKESVKTLKAKVRKRERVQVSHGKDMEQPKLYVKKRLLTKFI